MSCPLLIDLAPGACAWRMASQLTKGPPPVKRQAFRQQRDAMRQQSGSYAMSGAGERVETAQGAGALIAAARRITIKIGSSLVIDPSEKRVRRNWLGSVGTDIAALRAADKQIVVVSSGAVALGRVHLGLRRSKRLDHKQAAAAAGQALLMQAWEEALSPHGIPTAQLLLTIEDTEQRRRWLNARATMEVLFAQKALPVINENDSVATDELRYGDNDRLSARAAQMIRSDL